MSFKKSINLFRKKLTKLFFVKSLNTNSSKSEYFNTDEIQKILIVRPNHRLGNQLLITPLIQEVIKTFPNAKIHLFLKGGVGSIVFENYSEIEKIISLPKKPFKNLFQYISSFIVLKKTKYDLVINTVGYSSSGTIATKMANSKNKIFGIVDKNDYPDYVDYLHNAKRPVYDFREGLSRFGVEIQNQDIDKMVLKLSVQEIEEGSKMLKKLTENNKKTICIFTYATADKKLSKEWWMNFYRLLQEHFVNYTILEILPVENVSQIDFIAPSYYSKNIRQMASLIENADLFIGADSGIMHLSNSTNTPTVGLFSVTNVDFYQPFGNKSLGVNINTTSQKEIIETAKSLII